MTILAIVDTPEAVARARRDHADARIATDNPILAAVSPGVENIDALIAQAEALELGANALAITAAVERRLASSEAARRLGLPPSALGITGPLSRLVASILHRGAALARALETAATERIALLFVETPPWEPRQPLVLPRFANPARSLAEQGFFAPRPWTYQAVPYPLPERVNDTAIRDLGRRLAMMPVAQIVNEALFRIGIGRGAGVVVGKENEAVREALPWLALSGIRMKRAGSLTVPASRTNPNPPAVEVDDLLRAELAGLLDDGVDRLGEFGSHQRDAIVSLLLRHLSAGLAHLAGRLPELRERVEQLFPRAGGVLVTNGLFGPAGMLVHRLCQQRGVRVIEFEHGVTAGIAALTDTKLEHGGPPPVETLLVCSARSARSFNGAAARPARAVGLPDQVRNTLRHPVQRWLAQRALGLGRGPVVMHVSTLPYHGNHRPGLGAPTETTTFTIDRTLIEGVYPRVPHHVVFKQYPTQRFPFEPDYSALFKLSPNISLRKEEDFRYIRAAADVIVTMTPTSTLGWCVGAGVPIVWLDSRRINPLDGEDLRAAFGESFLFVDLDSEAWADHLLGLLDRPLAAIRADWAARRPAREKLYAESISGPAGTVGRRAARIVAEILRGQAKGISPRVAPETGSRSSPAGE